MEGAMAEDRPSEAVQDELCSSRRASTDTVPFDFADPLFSSDEFRIWEMKIRRCPRARPHDWTLCPYAHPVSSLPQTLLPPPPDPLPHHPILFGPAAPPAPPLTLPVPL